MGDDRRIRGLEEALRRVVAALLPELPGEDNETFALRRESTLEAAKEAVLCATFILRLLFPRSTVV